MSQPSDGQLDREVEDELREHPDDTAEGGAADPDADRPEVPREHSEDPAEG